MTRLRQAHEGCQFVNISSLRSERQTTHGWYMMLMMTTCTVVCVSGRGRQCCGVEQEPETSALKTLTDHVKPTDHRHAVTAEQKGQTWIDVRVKINLVKRCSTITVAFKTCYWLITQEVANCKYKPMLEFLLEQHMTDALFLN